MQAAVFTCLGCKMNPNTLLKKLIAIESVSGSETAIGDFLFSFLSPYFEVRKIQVENDRFNVLAVAGTPTIYFNTHLDTVPAGNNVLKEDDRFIYGRGACDAKGSMAAMICAAIAARKEGLTDFGLFFNIGEEEDFCGILNGLPEDRPKFVVIGEPTELKPVIGQRGLLGFKLSAKGKKAHGATPELGECAISKIVNAISLLKSLSFPEDMALGKSSLNIGKISGGSSINTVPDLATIWVEIRTVAENSVYRQMIEEAVTDFEIEYISDFNPVILQDSSLLSLFESITNKKPGVKKAFTELYFWPRGIILGPGSAKQAHSDNEFVSKEQLSRAVGLYSQILKRFAKQTLKNNKREVM